MTPAVFTRVRHLAGMPLVRSSAGVLAGTLVAQAFGFLFWLIAARRFSPDAVGVITAAGSTMTLSAVLVAAGVPPLLLRVLPVAGPRAPRIAVYALAWSAGAAACVGAVLAMATQHTGLLAAGLTVAGAGLTGFVFSADAVATAARATSVVTVRNMIASGGKTLLLFAPVPTLGRAYGITAGLLGWVGALAAAALWQAWSLRGPVTGLAGLPVQHIPAPVRAALAHHVTAVGQQLAVLSLPLITAVTLGPVAAGLFYVPWFIGAALFTIPTLIAGVTLTEAARDERGLPGLLRRTVRLYLGVLALPVLVITVGAGPLLRAFSPEYAAGATMLSLLAVSTVPCAVIALTVAVWRVQHRLLPGAVLAMVSGVGATLALTATLRTTDDFTAAGWVWLGIQVIAALVCLPVLLTSVRAPRPAD